MTDLHNRVRSNLALVEERIAKATASAGRPEGSVKLIGVTKYVGAEETAALVAAGCYRLGESRPQQLWNKVDSPELASSPRIEWRLIGHLQRNKTDRTLAIAASIDGVDSERLLKAIDQSATKAKIVQRVLLEVNTSGDEAKHGFTPDQLRQLVPELVHFPHIQVEGLMTMAAREGGTSVAAKNFADLRILRDEIANNAPPSVSLKELSMGMSGDFEQAIHEGSTLVRIGSALWEGIR